MASIAPKPLTPQINWNNPITKGMLLDASMHEKGGPFVLDIVNRNKGVITSAVWTSDLFGPCLAFSSATRLQMKSSAILSGRTNFTIAALMRPTSATQGTSAGKLYSERNAAAGNDIISLDYSGTVFQDKMQFTYRDDANTLNQPQATTLIVTARWSYVVVTKQGTALTFYINGINAGIATLTTTDTLTNSVVCQIGNDPRDGNSSFFGKIASVRLWGRAISSKEVKQLYSNQFQIYQSQIRPTLNTGIR